VPEPTERPFEKENISPNPERPIIPASPGELPKPPLSDK
jgi:hypothetical protein